MIPIIFGNRSFLLSSYEPWELDLDEVLSKDVRIEKRVAYFHLFFIPAFNRGQFWTIRKDGELYEPSDELVVYLETVEPEPRKTPWYAYSFWVLLLLGILFYAFYESIYSPYCYQRDHIEYLESSFAQIQEKDIYEFTSEDGDFDLRVLKVRKDSILFELPACEENLGRGRWLGKDTPKELQVTLAKKDVEQCIGVSYYISKFGYGRFCIYKFEGFKIKELNFLSFKPFIIESISAAYKSNVGYSYEEGGYYLDYD